MVVGRYRDDDHGEHARKAAIGHWRHVVSPLRETGAAVGLVLCSDEAGAREWLEHAASFTDGIRVLAHNDSRSSGHLARVADCWWSFRYRLERITAVSRAWRNTSQHTRKHGYDWVLRSRPDLLFLRFFGPATPLAAYRDDSLHVRAHAVWITYKQPCRVDHLQTAASALLFVITYSLPCGE